MPGILTDPRSSHGAVSITKCGPDPSCHRRSQNGQIAERGKPASVQAGKRWPVERTHACGNGFGKLRWCTERRRRVVEFWVAFAQTLIIVRRLIRRAWTGYRWQIRPHRRP